MTNYDGESLFYPKNYIVHEVPAVLDETWKQIFIELNQGRVVVLDPERCLLEKPQGSKRYHTTDIEVVAEEISAKVVGIIRMIRTAPIQSLEDPDDVEDLPHLVIDEVQNSGYYNLTSHRDQQVWVPLEPGLLMSIER